MRTISHSEACSFWDCPYKWKLIYKDNIKKSNIYLEFGEMAHKVLETREIPDEALYSNLKDAFDIKSWDKYFKNIFNTLDNLLSDYNILNKELKINYKSITGVIDLVCQHKQSKEFYLFDYKFTENPKTYDDIFLDEQLKIYAYLMNKTFWIDYDKINVGYISIPKKQIDYPQILKNGTLSKSKSQQTTYELYVELIDKLKLNKNDYLDILEYLHDIQYIKTIISKVDEEQVLKTILNLENTIYNMDNSKLMYCNNSAKCKNCDYIKECKY